MFSPAPGLQYFRLPVVVCEHTFGQCYHYLRKRIGRQIWRVLKQQDGGKVLLKLPFVDTSSKMKRKQSSADKAKG